LTSSDFSISTTRRICLNISNLQSAEDGVASTYVDRPEASAVAGSHIGVESLNGGDSRGLAVLLVHVVGAGAGVVADPDTEVLDLQGVLLRDLYRRVSFLSHTFSQTVAHTTLTLTISPVVFFTFWRPRRKYQKRDLATTALGAKIRMR